MHVKNNRTFYNEGINGSGLPYRRLCLKGNLGAFRFYGEKRKVQIGFDHIGIIFFSIQQKLDLADPV